MPLYKIDLYGRMAVVKADSLAAAKKDAAADNGIRNNKSVTRATEQDVDWFKTMGGYIYEV